MVVDDMSSMRQLMKAQLNSLGVTKITEAKNAAGVLELLRDPTREPINLLLLDFILGEATDGQQLLEVIRHEGLIASSAVVCMVTAEQSYKQVAGVAEHAPDAYLIKPFTANDLESHILPVLTRKQGAIVKGKRTPGLKPIYDQYDAGNYGTVLRLVDAYAIKEGVKADTARLKGDALTHLGDLVGASEHYGAHAGAYPWAVLGLARINAGLGRTDEAISALTALQVVAPNYVPAADALAGAYLKAGDATKAMEVLDRAVAKSGTVARLRAASKVAERLGDSEATTKYAGKAMEGSRHSLRKDFGDHARYARGLLAMGDTQGAVVALSKMTTENPALKSDVRVLSVQVCAIAIQLADELNTAQGFGTAMRERRMALLADKQARIREMLDSMPVPDAHADPESAVYLSEALLAGGEHDKAAELAAKAVASGAVLRPNEANPEWRDTVAGLAADEMRVKARQGLTLLREGKVAEAVAWFDALAQHAPESLAPVCLGNVVMAGATMYRRGGKPAESYLAKARVALARLQAQFPTYDRLPGLEQAVSACQLVQVGATPA